MKLIEYIYNADDELVDRQLYVDKSLMELHSNGYYVVGDLSNVELDDGEITLNSFKNKVDYINSGYNVNGDKQNILEFAVMTLMAYNNCKFPLTKDMIKYVANNYEQFLVNENIDDDIKNYYRDIFNGKFIHLNEKLNELNGGKGKANVKVKATQIGKSFADKEAAYVNVLLLPATITLIYLVFIVTYVILKYI